MIKAAVMNPSCGKKIVRYLLECEKEVKITEEVLIAAAGNTRSAAEVMKFLLKQRPDQAKITENVIEAVAENQQQEVMMLLLDRREPELPITAKLIKAIAWMNKTKKEVMTRLLQQCRDDVKITTDMIVEVAASFDREVMELLLQRAGRDVWITEDVLGAVERNYENGEEVLLLLKRTEIHIEPDKFRRIERLRNTRGRFFCLGRWHYVPLSPESH